METDLDDNNMDSELAKISADPQKRVLHRFEVLIIAEE